MLNSTKASKTKSVLMNELKLLFYASKDKMSQLTN